jgi:hypothetical protein
MHKKIVTRRYSPPVKYTADELEAAKLADLETDLRCAYRDGLMVYASELELEIDALKMRVRERTPRRTVDDCIAQGLCCLCERAKCECAEDKAPLDTCDD